ncbi:MULTISPECIES: type IA DNA topoisomerase [Methylobacterium]|uniref:type IA DNA topoisomerase n=1 Tax=Methylobacterium TaxID=407 RepID=UPI0019104FB8|nr:MULTISPECIES: DNA topoisomerase [Methylobacterium]MCI9881412.1 DNA topoisomerase [Methylobacterium goesingense]
MSPAKSPAPSGRTLFFFEKPSAMRQLQRFFRSPGTVCVAAEGHLLTAEEPGRIRPEWKSWQFETLPIVLDTLPVICGTGRSGQSHAGKLAAIGQALRGVERVIIATDPGREGSMIAWEVLEHLGWRGRVDRLKLGALDDVSVRRAFATLAREPESGEQDYAAYLEALCRQYEDYHLGLNGTRAISLRLRPPAFREPWRFGGVQTPTLAILADLEARIRAFVPREFFKVALHVETGTGAALTLWHLPKERIFERSAAETIRTAAAAWSGPLAVVQKDVRRAPPRLFSKDTLARRCAKRFGWDPQHTARLAQDLYDQGYLSYPRTESESLPEGQAGDAGAVMAAIGSVLADLRPLLTADAPVIRRGARGHYVKDPGEHHAIVPLRKVPERGRLEADLFRLWELVAKAYAAAHLPDGIDARTEVAAEVATPLGAKRFAVSGRVVRVPGWRALYGAEADVEADLVPGKARPEDEARAARLPAVDDGEAATAAGADIAEAVTEPPRRITRGELPVVMGRLIDQVDDPAAKRALENPVNPNEPKGLGTAATRDSILPKLLKSHYLALGEGKDPALTVTEVGLAFIAAVRRVFPAYGDPVGRAMFEAELAEIGRAPTRAEARARAEAFRARTRARLDGLISAIAEAGVVSLDPSLAPPSRGQGRGRAGGDRPPTPAMAAFAVSLAARKGIALPRGCKSSLARCRAFLDAEAGPAAARAGAPGGARPPSAAMLRYARSLAAERGLDCPPEIETQFEACRRFLDAHAASAPTGRAARQARPGPAEPMSVPAGTSPSRSGKPKSSKSQSGKPRRRPAAARAASGS